MDLPAIILALGLPRSGSTWVYNAARLTLDRSNRPTVALFADKLDELPAETGERPILVKSHTADRGLRDGAMKHGLPVLISLRDPRDAVASAIGFTGARFEVLLDLICASVEIISQCLDYPGTLIFRYEDGAIGEIGMIERIATSLGLPQDAGLFAAIHQELSAERVQGEIARLVEAGHFGPNPDSSKFDPVSHWHPNHIADGRIGKYRDMLTSDQIAVIEDRLGGFMAAFYPGPR